jgi:hypothetical protein
VYVPDYPADLTFLEALTDSGRWREQGVTHWHLTLTEIGTGDRERYSPERWARIVHREFIGTESEPRAALAWITEQRARAISRSSDPGVFARRAGFGTREGWEFAAGSSWDTLTRHPNTPAGGGIAVRDGSSVEIFANPMTRDRCRQDH